LKSSFSENIFLNGKKAGLAATTDQKHGEQDHQQASQPSNNDKDPEVVETLEDARTVKKLQQQREEKRLE